MEHSHVLVSMHPASDGCCAWPGNAAVRKGSYGVRSSIVTFLTHPACAAGGGDQEAFA